MKSVSAMIVVVATWLAIVASAPVVDAQDPFRYCDFFLVGYTSNIPVLPVCPKGDKAYVSCPSRIFHRVVTNTAVADVKVKVANSEWCGMSAGPDGPWDICTCANKFSTINQWVHKRNLQDGAVWFLNKYIKIKISSAQYEWGNYNSQGSSRDCLIVKTGDDFPDNCP